MLAGYIKLSVKHIFRKLLLIPLTFFAVGLVGTVVALLFSLFVPAYSPIGGLVIGGVLGLAASFFLNIFFYTGFNRLSFGQDKYSFNKYPRYVGLIAHLLLHLLGESALVILLFLSFRQELVNLPLFDGDDVFYLYMIVSSLIAIEITYCYWAGFEYKTKKCSKCKHVFCLKESSKTKDQYNTYSYSEKTGREKIGSVGSVDVYADVTRGKIKTKHHTVDDVHYECLACGHKGDYTRHMSYTE